MKKAPQNPIINAVIGYTIMKNHVEILAMLPIIPVIIGSITIFAIASAPAVSSAKLKKRDCKITQLIAPAIPEIKPKTKEIKPTDAAVFKGLIDLNFTLVISPFFIQNIKSLILKTFLRVISKQKRLKI